MGVSNKPAFPLPDVVAKAAAGLFPEMSVSGLTRRELFILGMAMAWRISESEVELENRLSPNGLWWQAKEDVAALIAELDKEE